jgi:molybdopterin molybdotransferase
MMSEQKKALISADEAWALVQKPIRIAPEELTPIEKAAGKVLRRPIVADADFPPFDRVTMDGIAIAYDAFAKGNRHFRIQHTATAGTSPLPLNDAKNCIEIMTGAPLPPFTDTVIRYEDLEITEEKIACIKPKATIQQFQNIHFKGSDAFTNQQLVAPGTLLAPEHIAVAAACGYHQLYTSRMPTVAIIGTGDELVSITTQPLPYQIRQSNTYMLAAALTAQGIQANMFHLPDQPSVIAAELSQLMTAYELIILSGGVSAGKADHIPRLLEALGVVIVFHGVKQKPGKPLLFGYIPTGTTVFALPGNPVSAFICLKRYVMCWLQNYLQQQEPPANYARLTADVTFSQPLTYFLQVNTFTDSQGIHWAEPVAGGGSGDFVNLLSVNGFLILPPHQSHFKKGESYPLLPF